MRRYAENELHVRPGIVVTVGQANADIIGKTNAALQAAVDYVAALGGGIVEIGPGEYLMSDSLHMRSGVTVRGAGAETVLKKDASVRSALMLDGDALEEALTLANANGFDIGRGVYVCSKQARGFQATCATILNRNGNYMTLSRPLHTNVLAVDGGYAATVYSLISACGISDFRIENLTIDGNKTQNEYIDGCRGSGVFFLESHGGVIENCMVRNFNGDGIGWQKSNDCQVLSCVAEGNTGLGLHPGSGSQRPIVRHCKSLNNGSDGFYFCWRVRNAVVEDNEMLGNGGYGISIGHKDSDNTVRRNVIAENAQGGVYWRKELGGQAGDRIHFYENTVIDNGDAGIIVDERVRGVVIERNKIVDSGKGVQATGIRICQGADVMLRDNEIKAVQPIVEGL